MRPNQVLHLFNKNSELLEIYLDYYKKKSNIPYKESKISNCIAKKNPDLLFKLEKEEKIYVSRLGRRTTKNVIDLVKTDVRQDFKRYQTFFNQLVLIKNLGEDFKDVYLKIFPKKSSEVCHYSECKTILKYYPKNKRWPLFANTFHTKFPDKNINSYLGEDITLLNPSREVMGTWAEHVYKKENRDVFIKYMSSSKAIPVLKEKINLTSESGKRIELVELLLGTCKVNEDFAALEEVLKYFCFRHRNEDLNFRQSFLSRLDGEFKLDDFNETHWKYINEQIKIMKIQKEVQFWRIERFLEKHLEFVFKTGRDFKDYVIDYIKYNCQEDAYSKFALNFKNPEVERKILIEILKVFPDIETSLPGNLQQIKIALMKRLFTLSEEFPDYFIDFNNYEYLKLFLNKEIRDFSNKNDTFYQFINNLLLYKLKFPQVKLLNNDDEVMKLIVKICQNNGYSYLNTCIHKFILKKIRNNFENQLLNSYFNIISIKNPDFVIINWFLKYEPTILVPFFTEICKKFIIFDGKLIKLLSHFGFDDETKRIYTTKLDSDVSDDYLNVVEVLQKLLPTNEYATLINNKFIPIKPKLDLNDEDQTKTYKIQCTIAKNLHRVEQPLALLDIVPKFCVGDYFQSALPALQSVFYRSIENQLYSHMEALAEKAAISVRKHALFLSCEILKQQYVLELLQSKEESNVSSEKHLFLATLKYYIKNPREDLWELLIKNLYTIVKNDTETLERLANINIPKKYKARYIEKCWEFFEKIKLDDVNVDKYFETLLINCTNQTDILVSLPSGFVKNIIDNYYFKTSDSFHLGRFIIKYLDHKGYTDETLLTSLLNILVKEKKSNLKDFFSSLWSCSDLPKNFVVAFSKYWNKYFNIADAFEEHVCLHLLLLSSISSSSRHLAETCVTYINEIISQFSLNAFGLLHEIFNKFVNSKNNKERYELFYDMVNIKPCSFVYILVLQNIIPVDDDEDEHFELYQSIIESIRNVEDPIVKIYYGKYIEKNLICEGRKEVV